MQANCSFITVSTILTWIFHISFHLFCILQMFLSSVLNFLEKFVYFFLLKTTVTCKLVSFRQLFRLKFCVHSMIYGTLSSENCYKNFVLIAPIILTILCLSYFFRSRERNRLSFLMDITDRCISYKIIRGSN
jgi:hypothetical protein